MCVICSNEYNNLETNYYLDCCEQVTIIPKEFYNAKVLFCVNSKLTEIPKELIKLEILYCSYTYIKEIPKELINLKTLYCNHTEIKEIPKELINLRCFGNTNINSEFIVLRQKKIRKGLYKFITLYKKYKLFKILWKIAEYYIKKKYAPENILKYIQLG